MTDQRELDLTYWHKKLAVADEAVQAALQRRDAIRRIIQGAEALRELDGPPLQERETEPPTVDPRAEAIPASKPPQGSLRGREAIQAVMAEAGKEMEQRQIYAVMKRNGWIEPGLKDAFSSVRVTLRRMWQKGDLEKPRDGVYRLPATSGSDDSG